MNEHKEAEWARHIIADGKRITQLEAALTLARTALVKCKDESYFQSSPCAIGIEEIVDASLAKIDEVLK